MRHPIWYRVLISLWAVWFSTALIEPAGFFACAMHSGMAAETSAPVNDATSAAHHEHAAHTASTEQSASAPAAQTADPEHERHAYCTCLGQCSTMTAAVVPHVDITIAEHLSRQTSAAAAVVLSRIPLRPAHALPFANGPPARVLA
jgi:hypothetical protein